MTCNVQSECFVSSYRSYATLKFVYDIHSRNFLASIGNSSWCFKTFFGGNLDFPKAKKLNKVRSNILTLTKMWSQAIFKQSYTLELFISLKMAISCCFGLRGNLEFPDFPPKFFYNINYRNEKIGEKSNGY